MRWRSPPLPVGHWGPISAKYALPLRLTPTVHSLFVPSLLTFEVKNYHVNYAARGIGGSKICAEAIVAATGKGLCNMQLTLHNSKQSVVKPFR